MINAIINTYLTRGKCRKGTGGSTVPFSKVKHWAGASQRMVYDSSTLANSCLSERCKYGNIACSR